MARDAAIKSFYAVLGLALVCSFLVAGAAVGLRARQEANRQLDRKKNILRAAGLYHGSGDVATLFDAIETRIVRLADGAFVSPREIDPVGFNQLKAAMTPELGQPLSKEMDRAGLGRVEKYSLVYLVKENNRVSQVILPIRGKGLWSTMYGYVALAADLSTISGITFYEHGETPGLGGEIENQAWQAGWRGKEIYDQEGRAVLRVVKGKGGGAAEAHRIDGISGATLTMTGVNNLLSFWFGDHGFQPFLKRYGQRGGIDG